MICGSTFFVLNVRISTIYSTVMSNLIAEA